MIAREKYYLTKSAYGFKDHPEDKEAETCGLKCKIRKKIIKYFYLQKKLKMQIDKTAQ